MKHWRFIFTGANDAFFNMALDEALLLSCQKGDSPPVLRLYLWKPPAVSMGYFQSAEKTVDLKKCKDKGVDVVRRITGGRAVLHEDEITYSVCASSDYFDELGKNTIQTYQKLSMALLESLHVLGIVAEWVKPSLNTLGCSGGGSTPARTRTPGRTRKESAPSHIIFSKPCFVSNSRYEIAVRGKKLIGSAQRRFSFRSDQDSKDSFIQHGSILLGEGKHSLAELLPEESLVEIVKQNLEDKSTNIEKILKRRVGSEEIISALKVGFGKVFDVQIENSVVSKKEMKMAQSLKEKKYRCESWNLLRFVPLSKPPADLLSKIFR